jgi:hypothetical protein
LSLINKKEYVYKLKKNYIYKPIGITEKNTPKIKSLKFFNEFKEFIVKGNVIDLAVAVVISSSFGTIISSIVSDLITTTIKIFSLECS